MSPSLNRMVLDLAHIPFAKRGRNVHENEHLANGVHEKKMVNSEILDIVDIRRSKIEKSILDDILVGLRPKHGQAKKMPTLLLYDEAGLKLFEDITYLEEYYLTNAEIDVLERFADQLASSMETGSMMIELGSGNLRKVNILLKALERAGKNIDYYALDLSLSELRRTLAAAPVGKYVKCHGLHGTYDDALHWLKSPRNQSRSKCIMSLGSSIGNFTRDEAAAFLRSFSRILRPSDTILIGLDACKDSERVYHAYNDRFGLTHTFILNGLTNANKIIGKDVFKLTDWIVIGEYDADGGRHQAFYSPKKDLVFEDIYFKKGERVRVEISVKYSEGEQSRLWKGAELVENARFGTMDGQYNIHVLSPTRLLKSSQMPMEYAASPSPSLSEWESLWAIWDTVTLGMISKEDLLSKPIKLRNACIFYLGHIPTFLDIHLTRATGKDATEPKEYQKIFERGIDPDVDNPEQCHDHSEIPESWPLVNEILSFQRKVRQRVRGLYESKEKNRGREVDRALWLGHEHEMMHLETLLYMLLMSDKMLPPPNTVIPDFKAMAETAQREVASNEWIQVPESTFTIGLDDHRDDASQGSYFGWDNEKPPRSVHVHQFTSKARPITNEEYALFLEKTGLASLPASWIEQPSTKSHKEGQEYHNGNTNGQNNDVPPSGEPVWKNKAILTVYGPVSLEYALHWPVMASYDELVRCASWMGGRIPTANEVRSIYRYVDNVKAKEADQVLAKMISAVNGHLSNDGVSQTPPSHPSPKRRPSTEPPLDPRRIFTDLQGCNVGFQHWHPTPVTQLGNRLCGQGEMGGVWEWTSSVLEAHEGFSPMKLYPGYTADFFDGKHNIVLGGSWATLPRIAGRKTFVNWYQHNYPYAWVGARVVRDD